MEGKMVRYENLLLSKTKGFFIVRSKDYRRVLLNLKNSVQSVNRKRAFNYTLKLYGEGFESFEGVEFDKEAFISEIKEGAEVVAVFRLPPQGIPFTEDEIVHFVEKYVQNKGVPGKIFILDPDFKITARIEPHVDEVFDYFPDKVRKVAGEQRSGGDKG